MITSLRTSLIFVLFFLPIGLLLGQGDSVSTLSSGPEELDLLHETIKDLEDEINRPYFTKAVSKNYAIACARFAQESYFYAKDIHQGYNLNRTYAQKSRANADTSFWFLEKAVIMADSAIFFASDTDNIALDYMHRAKAHLAATDQYLRAIYTTAAPSETRHFGTKSMFEASNALVDAYHASLYFSGNKRDNESDEDYQDRKVTRLEADEAAFSALLYLYEERIKNLEEEVAALEAPLAETQDQAERDRLQGEIDLVNEEKALVQGKLGGARNQLDDIDSQLDLQDLTANKGGGANDPSGNPDSVESEFPMDQEIPLGLVYRVQIGYSPAANTPIFHGVTAIDGKLDGTYIRYYTGMYPTYAEATEAKNKVREFIIDDAFLVAFYDRKQVSVYDALRIEKQQGAAPRQD
jgi:hypothetical protein